MAFSSRACEETEQASALLAGTLRKRCHTRGPGRVPRIEWPTECKPSSRSRRAGAQTSSPASSRTRTANQHKADVARADMDQESQTSSADLPADEDIATPGACQTSRSD